MTRPPRLQMTEQALRAALIDLRQDISDRGHGAECLYWAHAAVARVRDVFPGVAARVVGGSFALRYSADPDGTLGNGPDAGQPVTYLGAAEAFHGHAWAEVGPFLADASFGDKRASALRLYEADGRGEPPDPWPFDIAPLVMPVAYLSRAELQAIAYGRKIGFGYHQNAATTREARRRGRLQGVREFALIARTK